MAVMLDQLEVKPGQRVLEIGAGTGYNAALLAHLAGPEGRVTTVDIDEDIVEAARAHLVAAGFGEVHVICGDGAQGYVPNAPYDRIILTVSAWDIAPAWIEQLTPDGRLVLPLALNGAVQKLVAFERTDDHLASISIRDGSFMPLRGSLAGPPLYSRVGPEDDCVLSLSTPRSVDTDRVYALLTGPYQDLATSIHVTQEDLWGGVSLWLTLHAPNMCGIMARGETASRGIVPAAIGRSAAYTATMGLLDDTGLCLLAGSNDGSPASESEPFSLTIRSYGQDDGLADRLIGLLQEWDRAGRRSSAGLRIRAYPANANPPLSSDGARIEKQLKQLVLDWP
jgi:protein-L-isoaspartate(D-aspartate) O-methyltransferase